MAVDFLCAIDETGDDDGYFYGGFSGPVSDWDQYLIPAWKERVLNGPPALPYLHMTDMREWNWLAKYGLKPWEGHRRLEEAVAVVRSMGSLMPIMFAINPGEYKKLVARRYQVKANHNDTLAPDYLLYQWLSFIQLDRLFEMHGENLGKVHFVAEENDRITRNMRAFHDQIPDGLKIVGHEHLIPHVGSFRAVPKADIHPQAVDLFAWHVRNHAKRKLDADGQRRYLAMIETGAPGQRRSGLSHWISDERLKEIGEGLAALEQGNAGADKPTPR